MSFGTEQQGRRQQTLESLLLLLPTLVVNPLRRSLSLQVKVHGL